MNEIVATLEPLSPALGMRDLKQLTLIIEALFAMTGRVTMLGISRWTEKGGSYRTVQRFFKGSHDWANLRWLLIKQQLGVNLLGVWLIAADEVTVTKSGKQTHGLGKFYSSIQNQPVKGLCFLNLSLVHVETRKSYPLVTEQLIREDVKKTAPKAVQLKTSKGKGGRPKGSKNKSRTEVVLSPFQAQLQGCIRKALNLIEI
jgi:putative transposase